VKRWRGAVALAVSALGLWFALRGTDWAAFRETLAAVRRPWLLAAVPAAIALEYAARAFRWQVLLSPVRRAPMSVHYPITAGGFFLNNVLPFRAGEAARAYWTVAKTGAPLSAVLATLAMDRLFDMLSLLSLLLLVMAFRTDLFLSPALPAAFAAATLAGLGGLFLIARFPEAFRRWTTRLRVPPVLARWAGQFAEGTGILRRTHHVAGLYVLSLSFWAMSVTLQQGMARIFGLHLSWIEAGWIVLAYCVGALLPSAPGYVGTLEAAGVSAFVALGHDKAAALPFILATHVTAILSSVAMGLPSLWFAGLSVSAAERAPLLASPPAVPDDPARP
jgi:uncharacterized protein (TIRG00374 family)